MGDKMTEDEKGLAEIEEYLGRVFGQHATSVRCLINAYLNVHHDELKISLKPSIMNGVRPINEVSFVKDLVTRSVAWWQKECAELAKLAS
jgi:hypothetical protein